jgi:sec-independent protein translocase protein TatB
VFGFSIFEVVLIGVVTLVAVGPQRLPGMLKNFGQWMRKLRKMTTDVRAQTGIDEMLRQEGIQGGLNELRSLVRGHAPAPAAPVYRAPDPYTTVEIDISREYPQEGPDAYGALPDDLLLPPKPKPAAQPATPAADAAPVPTAPAPAGSSAPSPVPGSAPAPAAAPSAAEAPPPSPAASAEKDGKPTP